MTQNGSFGDPPYHAPKIPQQKRWCGYLSCILSQEMRHINFSLGASNEGFGVGASRHVASQFRKCCNGRRPNVNLTIVQHNLRQHHPFYQLFSCIVYKLATQDVTACMQAWGHELGSMLAKSWLNLGESWLNVGSIAALRGHPCYTNKVDTWPRKQQSFYHGQQNFLQSTSHSGGNSNHGLQLQFLAVPRVNRCYSYSTR